MSGGDDLTTAVARLVLLPERRSVDGFCSPNFGDYAPAIERWEVIRGVQAPNPTVVSQRTRKPTLNQAFVEWMMGLEPYWVTGAKVSRLPAGHRAACLSLLGDGVVPQQAVAAFKMILGDRVG